MVGPRYIKGDGKFYSFNIIDVFSRQVYIEPQRTKQDYFVGIGLLKCWKTIGLPDYIQFDNALSFRGCNKHPRSFSLIIKLCLYFGVVPVFIPVREPWRNGIIEKFNDTYDKSFFRREWFANYNVLKRQSKNFQRFHNKHHRYSVLQGKTPLEVINTAGFKPTTIGANTKLPDITPVPLGNIVIIRFIRSDRMLNIFGEKFKISKTAVYSYVKAVIETDNEILKVYLGDELIENFNYKLKA